jgi:hypothetical protein
MQTEQDRKALNLEHFRSLNLPAINKLTRKLETSVNSDILGINKYKSSIEIPLLR